jgi:hypothetical protein
VGIEGGEPGGLLNDPVRSTFSVNIDSALGYVGTGGNWYNYTRVFDSGVYAPYIRISSGAGVNIELDRVTSDTTISNQITAKIGAFLRGGTGGYFSNYVTVPLQDAFGSQVVLSLSGTNTLRISPFNYANINYLAFVPVSGAPTPPYVSSATPRPGQQAPAAHPPISLVIADAGTGIDTNNIQLWLNGSNVTAGVSITSTNGGVSVTYDYGSSLVPFSTNTLQLILADTSIPAATRTNTWQFIAPVVYTSSTAFIEAEDYNYGGGLFISDASDGMNGPYNGWAYFQLTAVPGIDFHKASPAGTSDESGYRTNDFANGVGVQGGEPGSPMSDRSRGYFSVLNDSGLGYLSNNGGDWYNYTRVFKAGAYVPYLRAATASSINIELDLVTSDSTQSGQTAIKLGRFIGPNLGSFYNFSTFPLLDFFGSPVTLWLSGTNTLRFTTFNYAILNYLAFVAQPGGTPPFVVSATPAPGARTSQTPPPITIQIADAGSGINTNALQLFLNGSNVTASISLTTTNDGLNNDGVVVSYNYGAALLPFSTNTIKLVMGDLSVPPAMKTNSWTFIAPAVVTFPANTLFVEAEDYNFNGGQFISDASDGMSGPYAGWDYYGFTGIPEVDFHMTSPAAGADASGYRNNDFMAGVGIQGGEAGSPLNDLGRSTFSVTADSMLGYNANGKWYNYTRVFSPATYAVYARMASGSANPYMRLALDLVTSDPTQPNQTTNRLGVFTRPATTGFYDFATVPLTDSTGGAAFLQLSGTNTFHLTVLNQFLTVNYLAFVPVTLPQPQIHPSGNHATLTWSNTVGWYKLQSSGNLTTWVDIPNSFVPPITVPLAGTNQFFRLAPAY